MNEIIRADTPPPKQAISLSYMQTLANAAYRSGMFKKFGSPEAAFMVLQFGFDLGLSPTAALTSVHFYDGKPSMSGNLMWSLVKGHPSWRKSRIVDLTDKGCKLEWVEDGVHQGFSSFTEEEAKKAGLLSKNQSVYLKYPKPMYFNRAVSIGWKLYCPHLANGYTVYTPEELGQDVDQEGNPTTVLTIFPPATSQPEASNPLREEVQRLLLESGLTKEEAADRLGIQPADFDDPIESDVRALRQMATAIKDTLVTTEKE